jgi:4-amino-4-deoxy-L-arabinose transferase-like glycosyltransferase
MEEAAPESARDGETSEPEDRAARKSSPGRQDENSRLAALSRPFALGVAALILFATLGTSGIWDPYELDAADLSRRIAIQVFHADNLAQPGAVNGMPTLTDLRMGELPFTSMALGFKLFGLRDWTGRLPLAVWAFVGVVALHELLARLSGRKAALYGAIALATMPLYFMQARTMLGDIVTMASLSLAFSGLVGALLDRGRAGASSAEEDGVRTALVKGAWLTVGVLGLAGGYMSRGLAIGVGVPLLSVGFTWVALRGGGRIEGQRRSEDLVGALSLAGGLVAAGATIVLLMKTSPPRSPS